MSLGNPTSAADIHGEFDGQRTTYNTQAALGPFTWEVDVKVNDLLGNDGIGTRSVIFTPQDDAILRFIRLSVFGDGSNTIETTALLEAIVLDSTGAATAVTQELMEDTVSVSISTSAATETVSTTEYDTIGSTLYVLRRGVTYRFSVDTDDNSNAIDRVRAVLGLKAYRRRSRR